MNNALPLYKDPDAPLEERVDDLLRRMTIGEKIAQITSIWEAKGALLDAERRIDPSVVAARYPEGPGHVTRPSDAKGEGVNSAVGTRGPRATAELVNALQEHATGTRLGIPAIFHEEGLHGYAAEGAT